MRIISFFPRPIPSTLTEGLKDIAQLQYWQDLSDEEKDNLDDVRIVITNPPIRMDNELLTRFANLQMVASLGVGYDKFDLETMKSRGIVLTNTPSATSDDVADLALGLILALSRRIPQACEHTQKTLRTFSGFPLTHRVSGRRIGIAGLGHIGLEIARRAEGFKMPIGYTNLTPRDVPYRHFESLKEMAQWCDFLVLAMPGGAATHHIANREIFEALGKDGGLINIGRGELIDTDDLVEALKHKTIAGAALDVFEGEPAIDPRLADLDNLLMTPHVGSSTEEARESAGLQCLENIRAFLATGTAPNRVI